MAWLNALWQPSTHPENSTKVRYFSRRVQQFGWLIFLGITQGTAQVLLTEPGQTAEKIVIHYGSFNGAISLDELEASLGSSKAQQASSALMPSISPEVSARLKTFLTQPIPFLLPKQTENLFSSPSGEALLGAVAEVLLVGESTEQGAADLRTALVGAAASGEEVTGLNILRNFPGDLHWNARRTMALLQRQKQLTQETGNFLTKLDQGLGNPLDQSVQQGYGREVSQPWEKEDLRLQGPWSYRQAALTLWDEQRDRPLVAQLYLPEVAVAAKQSSKAPEAIAAAGTNAQPDLDSIPLMVMSHGLAANRHSRSFLAKHLASHGIAVAMVQHSGSDSDQFHGLLQGEVEDIASARSFIDRPQDISFLLDELDLLTQASSVGSGATGVSHNEWEDDRWMLANYPLQLEHVAVFGHSFGAYTALALAGAEINFAQLHHDCQAETMLLELSLVLQCQVRSLESQPMPKLKDGRVVALMLADPMSRSIFGPEELQKVELPVVWTGGERDRFTPFSLSQLPSFKWLGSEDKYLAIAEATRHVYLQPQNHQTGADSHLMERVAPHPQAVQDYTNALGLAFTRTYLHRDRRYQAYFAAPYGQQLSQAPHHLRLWSPNAATTQPSLSQIVSP